MPQLYVNRYTRGANAKMLKTKAVLVGRAASMASSRRAGTLLCAATHTKPHTSVPYLSPTT